MTCGIPFSRNVTKVKDHKDQSILATFSCCTSFSEKEKT